MAFGTQAPHTLPLMLTAVACCIKAQHLSRGEESNFAGLRGAWSCFLNRERDAAVAAKLFTLPTEAFLAEKSEARPPV